MKLFFGIFLLFSLSPAECFPQTITASVLHLNKLPADGFLLDKGWTFHPGDDPDFAKYDYNGKEGIPVNPALLLDQLPVVKNSGIGWFRLKLHVDSSLINQTIGISISLLGAAEIYLDGEQVYRFGNASTDYSKEKTQAIYTRAINLKLGSHEKQLLAVRYSYHHDNMYVKAGIIPFCLRIVLQQSNKNIDKYTLFVKRTYQFNGIALTILFAAALLTLFFFFSFRQRKEYLYFGLFFSCQFFGYLTQNDLLGPGKAVQVSANHLFFIGILGTLSIMAGSFFFLNGIYALLNIKRTRFYKFLVVYAIGSIGGLLFLQPWGSLLPTLFFLFTCFEILPVLYKAARRKFSGAWILFLSMLITFLFLAGTIKATIENDFDSIILFLALTFLTPALGLVIYLAGDFARTSSSLQLRIVEVEDLSKKTMLQDKEKQELLAAQKDKLEVQVQERTAELSKSLADLKATQTQLIQSEKMASLGELTAGIAHEIQNPLNFVNNFSDVNKELLLEMKDEIDKGNLDEAKSIATDVIENHEKINHHGKRADAIVKGMLQHSRTGSGQKEMTDINELADEYLRLSYHGLRAKDKTFNAIIKTDFDKNIGSIKIIRQDIGRVILNLINNAFYAVSEKQKHASTSSAGQPYEPAITIGTKRLRDQVEIRVTDNGNGIPQKVLDKIFQPFFTTKPTGQGTGLGLSLSYDIVKAHGGELKAETIESEGANFTMTIPAN